MVGWGKRAWRSPPARTDWEYLIPAAHPTFDLVARWNKTLQLYSTHIAGWVVADH